MKLKKKLTIEELDERFVALGGEDKAFRGMIYLNESGKFVAELLENEITKEEIINKMCKRYKIESDRAKTDLDKFLKTFAEAGLIDNES